MKHVAWIGLGKMGAPMARNLAAAGYVVKGHNRTPRQMDVGACQLAHTMEEAVRGAEVVFLMLTDAAAVQEVLFGETGALRLMERGTIVVNMSTVGVDETKDLALKLANAGVELVDAPVSGSVRPAEEGSLVVLAGGSEAGFKRVEPMLRTMGKVVLHLGPVSAGAAVKLCVNYMLAVTVAAVGEGLAVADKAGIGREQLLDALSHTGVWSPVMAGKADLWKNQEYPPAFLLKHMTKDVRLMANYAADMSVGLPILLATYGTYLEAEANGLAHHDLSAVAKSIRERAGVD